MTSKCIIKTEKSSLTIHHISDIDELISLCIDEIADKLIENPHIKIYGKICIQHRSIGFFSNTSIGYYYSGQLAKSQKLTENLSKLLNIINKYFNSEFNAILINKYKNGEENIGAHGDDEKFIDKNGVVALSCGAIRKFRIRNKLTKKIVIDIPTIPGEIIHMVGDFQKEFTHEIPVQKKIKEVRYSFTFRKHNK